MSISDPEKDVMHRGDPDSIKHSSKDRETHTIPSIDSASGKAQDAEPSVPELTMVQSRPMSVIPRSQRRGLFARLSFIPEVEEPHEYKRKIKWGITFVIAMAAMGAPIGSAIIYPALPQIAKRLHSNPTIVNLTISLHMISMSIFPLWWSSFSERFGRRNIYLISFALFVVFSALSAVSNSIGMLIVMRMLGGGAAASVQAVGAGTIADIWEVRERGMAMGIFYLGPLCGPLFAPIFGGALAEKFGWRSTLWFLAIYGFLELIMLLFCLPETLKRRTPRAAAPITCTDGEKQQADLATSGSLTRSSTRRSVKEKTKDWALVTHRFLIEPLYILSYLRFPAVLITVFYASMTFGALFILNISIQQTFSELPYSFSSTIVGLLYIPSGLGYVIGSIFGGRWMDYIMHREARAAGRYGEDGKLIYRPEDRMRENAWLAAIIFPAALVWYGKTVERGDLWIIPMIANFFFGLASMLIFSMATTMLTEFMSRRSSSGVAINNFVRNIFSCVGSVIAQPLIATIGNGWLFTAIGIICWASAVAIWAMRKFGPRWRVEMEKKMVA